jgi:hypothetical protein
MDAIGINVTHVGEDVTGRAARRYEAEMLNVPTGVPVLVIERTYYADERPVETADMVVSSDRCVLSYRSLDGSNPRRSARSFMTSDVVVASGPLVDAIGLE